MRKIQNIEVKKYSELNERGQVRHIGMEDAEAVFEQLKAHLEEMDLLLDEYFLLLYKGELPDYMLVASEQGKSKMVDFATGKTLGETGDDFLRMSRIAAECSLMLNGLGDTYEITDEKSNASIGVEQQVRMELQNFLQERLGMANHNLLAYSKNYLMDEPKDGYEADWMTVKKEMELIEKLSSIQDEIAKLLSTACLKSAQDEDIFSMEKTRESTDFGVGRDMLYVGDMVSIDSGYDGFMKVVKREDGYWLVDCAENISGQATANRDFKLECNLPYRYQVVDPIAPDAEPQLKIYCSQCDETVTGEIDFETGEITWNENCASHMRVENEIASTCRLCAADSGRIERMQQQKASLKAYLEAKRQEFGLDQVRVFDLWPYFGSISEIDAWFAVNAEKVKMLSEVLTSGYIDYLKNMEDK